MCNEFNGELLEGVFQLVKYHTQQFLPTCRYSKLSYWCQATGRHFCLRDCLWCWARGGGGGWQGWVREERKRVGVDKISCFF